MEENKAKEVKMSKGSIKKAEPKAVSSQRLTYEQLNDACNQLFQQNQQMRKAIEELNMANMFKRLDYLFKVVENAGTFKDSDFLNSCMDEIKETLTLQPEDNKAESKEK